MADESSRTTTRGPAAASLREAPADAQVVVSFTETKVYDFTLEELRELVDGGEGLSVDELARAFISGLDEGRGFTLTPDRCEYSGIHYDAGWRDASAARRLPASPGN